MGNRKTKTGVVADIVRQWLLDHSHVPNIEKNLTASKMIMADPEMAVLFKDVEDVRKTVRRIKGKAGEKERLMARHAVADFNAKFDKAVAENSPRKEIDFTPYQIKAKDVLVLSDLQYPYYDKEAFRVALQYAHENWKTIDCVFINGDWFDFYKASHFMKDPRRMDLFEELEGGCNIIKMIQDLFRCPVVLKFGNHEERFDNYITEKAGQLKTIPEFSLQACIEKRVPEGLTIVKDKRIVMIGKLPFLHGHEFGRGVFSPVNPARGLFTRALHSCVQGDCHRPSEHTEKTLTGDLIVTYSMGCLCQLQADFAPYNRWMHGFGRVQVLNEEGEYLFTNKKIVNHKVY
jgi:hypothetical protein